MITTIRIFGSWEGFRMEIRRVFGDIDSVKIVERKLFGLRQIGSAINYVTEFRKWSNQTKWGNAVLISYYRYRLKDFINFELSR
jgi:hypothetical protein